MTATVAEYRYTLYRDLHDDPVLGPTLNPRLQDRVVWVMLNPSTADEVSDDPTIRKVKGFSYRLGCPIISVVNLLPHRATKPTDLYGFAHGSMKWRGPNEAIVAREMFRADQVVFAWGAFVTPQNLLRIPSPTDVKGIAQDCGVLPLCLGKTKNGEPKHPLYVPYETRFEEF